MEQQYKVLDTYLEGLQVDRDYAALMLTEILFERGLVNKETLAAAREKVNITTDITQT